MSEVRCPFCDSLLAHTPEQSAEPSKATEEDLRAYVARVARDIPETFSEEQWTNWINAVPFNEFLAFVTHDWKAEPIEALVTRFGLHWADEVPQ